MRLRRQLLGLLAVPLLLGGCAANEVAAQTAQTAVADGGPPDAATMVCGPEISEPVTQILNLDEPPHTESTWVEQVYTCTYHLPMGPLVLSVNVSEDDEAAGAYFEARRAELPEAESLIGLGEQAYGTGTGSVVVVKDDMTLNVDASALPETFGDNGQKRTAFAFTVASQVMGCWVAHH